jgi:glyoxylase-like metal-dependent hydrolase (beta-lactamase superfamily II)
MTVEQIYTGCLAQGAYYIESNGEAVIIDPLREVEPYISRAERNGAKIKFVLETHFHATWICQIKPELQLFMDQMRSPILNFILQKTEKN